MFFLKYIQKTSLWAALFWTCQCTVRSAMCSQVFEVGDRHRGLHCWIYLKNPNEEPNCVSGTLIWRKTITICVSCSLIKILSLCWNSSLGQLHCSLQCSTTKRRTPKSSSCWWKPRRSWRTQSKWYVHPSDPLSARSWLRVSLVFNLTVPVFP